jgi:hypothetical protein
MENEKQSNKIINKIEIIENKGNSPLNRPYFIMETFNIDKILIHGGSEDEKENNKINILVKDTWKDPSEVSNESIYFIFDKSLSGHASCSIPSENKIFIYGGFDGHFYSNAMYLLDTDDFSFQQIDVRVFKGREEYPMPRSYHTLNYDNDNNCVYLYGGWNSSLIDFSSSNFTCLWRFDLSGKLKFFFYSNFFI